jgi:ABC-type sugar transport system permease subunit
VSFLPILYALRQSLYSGKGLDLGVFVGLRNFTDLLLHGDGLWFIQRSMLFVGLTMLFALPLGVGFGLLLSRPIRFRGAFRTILMFPWVVSQLITGSLWMWLYNDRLGPLSYLLQNIGIDLGSPLTDVNSAMLAVSIANVWHSYPLIMVFTLAALQTVPSEVNEAARMDASSEWGRFWHITFPLIRNTVMIAAVLTSLQAFNNVTLFLVMTGGGPVGATDVLAIALFKEAFQFYRMDTASTIAIVIFLLNIAFTALYVRILRKAKK